MDPGVKKLLDHGSQGQIPIGSWIQPPCVTPLTDGGTDLWTDSGIMVNLSAIRGRLISFYHRQLNL